MISPEQIEALQALQEHGTFMAAAKALHRSYTSINYLINTLEQAAGMALLDRTAYRTRLNAKGKAVLESGIKLLKARGELEKLAESLRSGWEPKLTVVYDGILDIRPIVNAILKLKEEGASTQVTTSVAYHEEVEREFLRQNAELMLTISPPERIALPFVQLKAFHSSLVVGKIHPLAQLGKCSLNDLRKHTLVTVKGSSARLALSTLELENNTEFVVGDFFSKKIVLVEGGGFGWMPEFLIQKELRNKSLVRISTEIANRHRFLPRLYHHNTETMGKATKLLLHNLKTLYAQRD